MITILEPLCSTYLFGLSRFGISLIIVQSTFSFSSFYKKNELLISLQVRVYACNSVHIYLFKSPFVPLPIYYAGTITFFHVHVSSPKQIVYIMKGNKLTSPFI